MSLRTLVVVAAMIGITIYVTMELQSCSLEVTARAQEIGAQKAAERARWKLVFEQHCKTKEVAQNVEIITRARMDYRGRELYKTTDVFDLIRYECDNGVSYWTRREGDPPTSFEKDYRNVWTQLPHASKQ